MGERSRFAAGKKKGSQGLKYADGDELVNLKTDGARRGRFSSGDAKRLVEHAILAKHDKPKNVRVAEVHVVGEDR